MEHHLKKRILGALVMVVALAIVMPVILDGQRSHAPLTIEMPPQPELEPWQPVEDEQVIRLELEKLQSGEIDQAVNLPEIDVVIEDDEAVDPKRDDKSNLDEQNLPYAWTLQLGAFQERKNAHKLRDRLRKQGYKAYVQEFAADKLTRVYVGPELQRSKIEALQKKLQALLETPDVRIKRYRAES